MHRDGAEVLVQMKRVFLCSAAAQSNRRGDGQKETKAGKRKFVQTTNWTRWQQAKPSCSNGSMVIDHITLRCGLVSLWSDGWIKRMEEIDRLRKTSNPKWAKYYAIVQ